jgi:hypothetical protein
MHIPNPLQRMQLQSGVIIETRGQWSDRATDHSNATLDNCTDRM